MRSRIFVGAILLVGALAQGTVATGARRVPPVRQSAVVNLVEPTLIGLTIVQGPVLFTHDLEKMARGEPCTTVARVHSGFGFDPERGAVQEVTSFHCIPMTRKVAGKFTMMTRPNTELGTGCVLTAFQFAGDDEAHGLPSLAAER